MSSALLFPGQGAPAGDWADYVGHHAPELLAHARVLLEGVDPFERFGDGTEFDQPATYCASLAAFEAAGRPTAAFHAGHSMGEISALACAGAMTPRDGVGLVVERGRLMAEAARYSEPGAMLAVGAPAAELTELSERAGLSVANLNSPTQTVLSGPAERVDAAAGELRAQRIKTKQLAVSGAFHSPAMAGAIPHFKRALERTPFTNPAVPVYSARSARPFADIASELAASLLAPVRWSEVVAALELEGVDRFVEIGPGRALAGLVRRSATTEPLVEVAAIPEAAGA